MDSIEGLWDRIETWLATNALDIANALEEGATDEEVKQAEKTMGLILPEDIKASLLKHKDFGAGNFLMGQSISYGLTGMVEGQQGLKDIWEKFLAHQKRSPKYLSGPIQPVWWHPSWLPLTGDGAGNLWCIDLAPAPEGHKGQIINFDHEVGPTSVVATSFHELLSTFATQLENRGYIAQGLNLYCPKNIGDDLLVLGTHQFIEETLPAISTISTSATISLNNLDSALNQLYREVRAYLEQQNIQPLLRERGLTAFARYEELANDQVALEVGVEVIAARTDAERMSVSVLPSGTIGTIRLFGLPTSIPDAFDELEDLAEIEQKIVAGQPWITFTIDPQASQEVPFIEGRFYFEACQLLKASSSQ